MFPILRVLLIPFFILILAAALTDAAPVLVDGSWLESRLDDKNIVLVDMTVDRIQYDRFHLPGAVYVPYPAIVKPREKDKVILPLSKRELAQRLGQFGIRRQHHVVIYDDMGGLNAGRLFWALEHIGHPQVSVLDGGLVKWMLDGRKVVNAPIRPSKVNYVGDGGGRDNLATLEDMDNARNKGVVVIDTRTIDEYAGDRKRREGGHVDAARWWEWSRSIDIAGGFVHKPAELLKADLNALGAGNKSQPIIAYCRSGHRAAQTYLTLRSLGYTNVKLYANSMREFGVYRANALKRSKRP